MSEIGLPSNLPSTGSTKAYTPPRVDSGAENIQVATPGVTTSTPDSGSTSSSPSPTQTVGASGETLSISSGAYRMQQAGASTTGAVDSTSDSGMDSEQAMARAQSTRNAMQENPQLAFQTQTGQISTQQVASLLRA